MQTPPDTATWTGRVYIKIHYRLGLLMYEKLAHRLQQPRHIINLLEKPVQFIYKDPCHDIISESLTNCIIRAFTNEVFLKW
jgi:hypothetical protein